MADRTNKRARRQIPEDSTDSSEEEVRRTHRSSEQQRKVQASGRAEVVPSTTNTMSRPRRVLATPAITNANQSSSVTVSRSPSNSPEERRRSIKLTVKMPSSKLREVTSQSSIGRSIAVNSRDTFEAGEIMTGKRSTRAQDITKLNPYNESDDADPWDDSEESDGLSPSPIQELSTTEDEEDEEEDEEDDDEEEMEAASPLPPKQATSHTTPRPTNQQIPRPNSKLTANPALIVTPAAGGHVTSVEQKEVEMENDEDEELSELDSNGEDEEQDETNMDAEGDEDELGAEEDAEGDVDVDDEAGGEIDSDGTPGSDTGASKTQTKRQRGQDEGAFLALPMEPQIKKILTADEHRMRRAEMARRRKNLSEKRNEEEKASTINRLLKRQVPKRRGKAMNPETLEAATAAEGASPAEAEEVEVEQANPFFVRWVNNKEGSKIGVPEEWLGKKVGRLFGPSPAKSWQAC